MRKFFSFNAITLDGFHEGTEGEFDFVKVDEEFSEFAIAQLGEIETIVFGRRTYVGMREWWTTDLAADDSPEITRLMNETGKIVVSRTLEDADWAQLVPDLAELAKIKEGEGKALAVFGSAELTVSLLEAGLLDEIRILISPVALGQGRPLFGASKNRIPLELTQTRVFSSGNVLLTYRPAA